MVGRSQLARYELVLDDSLAGRARSRGSARPGSVVVHSAAAGPALGRRCPMRTTRPVDVRVFVDLDAMHLGGTQDFPPCALLGRLALELGLIEAGDRIPHVRLVVDGEVFPALRVDIRELRGAELLPIFRVEFSHGSSPGPRGNWRLSKARGMRTFGPAVTVSPSDSPEGPVARSISLHAPCVLFGRNAFATFARPPSARGMRGS